MSDPQRLEIQDWMTAPETRQVMAALAAGGREARFVGGCVRDALLGRPVKDVDIATPDDPARVMALLRDAGIKVVPTGLDHGTVTAVAGHKPFEITTLREDRETDGRRAKVAFTDDWQADASRRDLTFNAMSCSADGRLFDPFGGRADLAAGRVRFVGDPKTRIEEDYLRLLRFFRFQAHYGRVPPEPALLSVMTALAPKLRTLSGERLRAEFLKLLTAADPLPVLAAMQEHGILAAFLPEAGGLAVLARLLAFRQAACEDPILRLAALLPPEAEAAATVAGRLRLSGAESLVLTRLAAPPPDLRQARRVLDGPDTPNKGPEEGSEGDLALRFALYHHGPVAVRQDLLLEAARRGVPAGSLDAPLARIAAWRQRSFPLDGSDVLALGVTAGPQVGELLRRTVDWWIAEDFVPKRAACLEQLRRLYEEAV